MLIVDNPVVSTLAGVLTTTDENKVDTSKVDSNLLAAGEVKGKFYGTPIGANTLALHYNKKVLKSAGVGIASVTDWTSLTAAPKKVDKAGKKGITFSAIGTAEGSFQFLPWFWGSGAKLTDLDSSEGVSALSLRTGWLKKDYAPNSVINNTQTTSWQEFASGDYAFAENGTWQLANAEKAGFDYGVLPVPNSTGGDAAPPTGGEFVTLPAQDETGRYTTSPKLAACLTSTPEPLRHRHHPVLHRPHQRGAGQAGGGEPQTAALGRRGEGGQGTHQRRPGYRVPQDLRADVEGDPVRPQRRRVPEVRPGRSQVRRQVARKPMDF